MTGITVEIQASPDICATCKRPVTIGGSRESFGIEHEAFSPIGELVTIRLTFCQIACFTAPANAEQWKRPADFQKWAAETVRGLMSHEQRLRSAY